MRVWLPALGVVVAATLGCGGLWNKAQARAWAELTVEAEVFPAGPDRQQLMDLLDEGYVRTATNEIGFEELIEFSSAFDDARRDNTLDPNELTILQSLGAAWNGTGQSPKRIAMIAEKRKAEEEFRQRMSRKKSRGKGRKGGKAVFADWEMPEDLRDRLKAAGVDVQACDSDVYDGLRTTDCEGAVGDDWVSVSVEEMDSVADAKDSVEYAELVAMRRDGRVVMELAYTSRAESKALAQAVLGNGDPLTVSLRDLKSVAKKAGFEKRSMECSEETDGGTLYLSCDLQKTDRFAYLTYDREEGARGTGEMFQEFVDGEWEIDAAGFEIEAQVFDHTRGETLIDAVLEAP